MTGDVGMLSPEALLVDGERALLELLGFLVRPKPSSSSTARLLRAVAYSGRPGSLAFMASA